MRSAIRWMYSASEAKGLEGKRLYSGFMEDDLWAFRTMSRITQLLIANIINGECPLGKSEQKDACIRRHLRVDAPI